MFPQEETKGDGFMLHQMYSSFPDFASACSWGLGEVLNANETNTGPKEVCDYHFSTREMHRIHGTWLSLEYGRMIGSN